MTFAVCGFIHGAWENFFLKFVANVTTRLALRAETATVIDRRYNRRKFRRSVAF